VGAGVDRRGHLGKYSSSNLLPLPLRARFRGREIFAIGATCTHYGGPLGEGLFVEDTVRCPWHHACFSLRTGEALAAPALNATSCWRIERRDGRIFARDKIPEVGRQMPATLGPTDGPSGRMVIIGGGGAGNAAAEMLRRGGYAGGVTIISDDAAAPYDRPNLSKDYLAGTAPEEWIPLRPPKFYADNGIELRLGTTATAIDTARRHVMLGGEELGFDKLLLATGAEPIRLQVPGADLPHVRTLQLARRQSRPDCPRPKGNSCRRGRRQLHWTRSGRRAASSPGRGPCRGTRSAADGARTGAGARRFRTATARESWRRVPSRPHGGRHRSRTGSARQRRSDRRRHRRGRNRRAAALHLAQQAGLAIDRGVLVNEYLETSAPGIFAAGDIARWPDAYSGEQLRIEHWVVAERHGQTAARNMLGRRERYAAVPFFWSQHYDVSIDYVGHANAWDEIVQDGDPNTHDAALRFRQAGRTLAVATIFRGRESLLAEAAMERGRSP
jgi:nitrite reductase/ring-hydroxylating ferredoxin subunit